MSFWTTNEEMYLLFYWVNFCYRKRKYNTMSTLVKDILRVRVGRSVGAL